MKHFKHISSSQAILIIYFLAVFSSYVTSTLTIKSTHEIQNETNTINNESGRIRVNFNSKMTNKLMHKAEHERFLQLKMISEKTFRNSYRDLERGKRIARSLMSASVGPELFNDAESNSNPDFNKEDLTFPNNMDVVITDLQQLRENQNNKEIIPDSLKIAALNVYIRNAAEIAKRSGGVNLNDFDVNNMEDLEENYNPSNEERRLTLENEKYIYNRDSLDFEPNLRQRNPVKETYTPENKNEGLLALAEQGKLFDINIDNIYKSVGETQVKNFSRMYGVKN